LYKEHNNLPFNLEEEKNSLLRRKEELEEKYGD